MALRLLGVPTSAGAYGPGQEQAPRALRAAGLVDALRRAGLDVVDEGDLPVTPFRPDPQHPTAQGLAVAARVAGEVRERVRRIVAAGDVAAVLGGDCTLTLGVYAGARDAVSDVGLAYLDGDADLSTPDHTRSGILDAMGVAHLLGVPGTVAELRWGEPIGGDRLALVGYEEFDLGDRERALLDQAGVGRFPADALRTDPVATARAARAHLGERPRVVHFDVDTVDSTDLPLAEFPHFNQGVSLADATAALGELCGGGGVVALTVTEANPRRDHDGRQLARLVEMLAAGWGRLLDDHAH